MEESSHHLLRQAYLCLSHNNENEHSKEQEMDSKSIASVLLRRLVPKQEMAFFPLRTGISPFFDAPRTGRLFYLGSCLFL